jgi:hypothetical protein
MLIGILQLSVSAVDIGGVEYTPVLASRLSVATVGGVKANVTDGAVEFITSLDDTSDWVQNSGEGSVASYTYCGVYIDMPAGATCAKIASDWNNSQVMEEHAADNAFLQGGKYQDWIPVGNCSFDEFSLFAGGREYIVLIEWYSDAEYQNCVGRDYLKITRNIAEEEESKPIERTEVDAERLSIGADQGNVKLNGKEIVLPCAGFEGDSVVLNVTAPEGAATVQTNSGRVNVVDGKASVAVDVTSAAGIANIEWINANNEAIGFESISYTVSTAHSLTHVEAVKPTYTAEGNKEYWKCEWCGKLFADAEGTKEITDKDSLVIAKLEKEDTDKDTSSEAPKTGDNNNVFLWISVLAVLCVAGTAGIIVYSKSKKEYDR